MRPLSRLAYLGAVLTACAVPPTDNPDLMTPPTGEVCPYEKAPLPSGIGERIMPGQVLAGTAESRIDLPVGTPLGGFTSRMKALGGHSPDDRRSPHAKAFVPSAGVQTTPLIRALFLQAGDEPTILVKADLCVAVSYTHLYTTRVSGTSRYLPFFAKGMLWDDSQRPPLWFGLAPCTRWVRSRNGCGWRR